MRTVKRIETQDGRLHVTMDAAIRHAEREYGLALSGMAADLVKIDKYVAMQEFIDSNLARFGELARLKADIQCEDND